MKTIFYSLVVILVFLSIDPQKLTKRVEGMQNFTAVAVKAGAGLVGEKIEENKTGEWP